MLTPRLLRVAPLVMLPAFVFAVIARAQPGDENKVQLEYVLQAGAESCPSETMMRHAIRAEMKVDPFSATAAAKLRVVIARKGRRFRATYEIIDATGKATPCPPVDDQDCKVVVEAVALDAGLHLAPLVTAKTPPAATTTTTPSPPSSPLHNVPTRDAPTQNASTQNAPTREEARRPSLLTPIGGRIDVGGLVSFGNAPKTTGGFSLHGGLRWSFFAVSLGLRYEAPVSDGTWAIQASTSRFLIEAVPCLYWRYLYACGLAQVGERMIRWHGPDHARHGTLPSASLGGRIIFEWPFTSKFAVYASGDATGTTWYTELQAGPRFYWRTPPLAGGAGGGVELMF